VNLTDFVCLTGVEEDALGRGRFAGVDVRGNTDVPNEIEWVTTGHFNFSFLNQGKLAFPGLKSRTTKRPLLATAGAALYLTRLSSNLVIGLLHVLLRATRHRAPIDA
jgi:hypothetical protein